ncbi:MAG: RnfABCDGE type electron transport complex subunit D [Bacillota bacterium]|nr:RnfABCDGE type electron transport complex subunit D [Bacillota bacterium]
MPINFSSLTLSRSSSCDVICNSIFLNASTKCLLILPPAQSCFNNNSCFIINSIALQITGGAYLLYNKYANWRIPASVIAAVIVCLFTGQNILFHLFSGSLILGTFFMATDPINSPKTDSGRYIFGAGVGIIIMAMRLWGWLPEGTTFAIIGMNLVVPLINRYTKINRKPSAV